MNELYGLLIVGGGPAGLAAARAFREHDRDRRVAIVSDEHRLPYARPPLTKELLRGESSEDELPIEPEEWFDEQRVELISGRVVALDGDERGAPPSGGRPHADSSCLLATGAEPARLPVPGADHVRVRVVRTLADVRELLTRLPGGERVAVVGSGFIGCEIASSLRRRRHDVQLVSDEAAPNVSRLGDEAAAILRDWLAEDGVGLHLSSPVERIESRGGAAVLSAGAERITADVIVMAAGVSPRAELAEQASIQLDGGAIPVDASMRTSRDGLLAAGDVAKAENRAAGRHLRVEHWGDALAQGRVAGLTAAGQEAAWTDVPGFWSTIGDRTLKYAAWGDGYDESRLERHDDGGFTAWYGKGARLVGVLAHESDDAYERGSSEIAAGASWPR